jgi:hypothetical protein
MVGAAAKVEEHVRGLGALLVAPTVPAAPAALVFILFILVVLFDIFACCSPCGFSSLFRFLLLGLKVFFVFEIFSCGFL